MTTRFDIDDLDPDERRRRARPVWEPGWTSAAEQRVNAALAAQAPRTARAQIKARARAYLAEPQQLAALGKDLPTMPPYYLVLALKCIANDLPAYHFFGNGGEIPTINLKAAMLCARFRRCIRARREA